jgi:hypothetical protein
MTDQSAAGNPDGEIEQCLEDIDEFLGTLERYPDPVIAQSLRIHLAALLRAMVDDGVCSREQVRQFVVALEDDALGLSET